MSATNLEATADRLVELGQSIRANEGLLERIAMRIADSAATGDTTSEAFLAELAVYRLRRGELTDMRAEYDSLLDSHR